MNGVKAFQTEVLGFVSVQGHSQDGSCPCAVETTLKSLCSQSASPLVSRQGGHDEILAMIAEAIFGVGDHRAGDGEGGNLANGTK